MDTRGLGPEPAVRPERPLRILYHHRIAATDGMRVHVTELVSALRARGHEVLLVGPGEQADATAVAGADSRLERFVERLRRGLPGWAYELCELAYNGPAYLRLARAARAFRPDVIYERYNLFLLAGLALRAQGGPPVLLEVNAPLAAERTDLGQLSLRGIGRRCEAALWQGADAILPVTAVLAEHIRKVRGTGQVHVIPNGADLSRRPTPQAAAAARRRLGLSETDVVLGFVGFVRAWHGVGWAVDALPQLPPNTHLVIVGDGPALPELQARAAALGVAGRLHVTGKLPHGEVPAVTQGFDIALQTGAAAYASPLKLFEYMALGRPVIAPDQPNIREVLTDGENALLFAPGDAAAFADALQRLCADAGLRRRLGDAALQTVEQRPLTWAHNAARIEALAEGLLRPSRERAAKVDAGLTAGASSNL
ncbi:glycosyltransferase family 4 protein [Phenylobacterium sp. LjRoot219]|uniref:glycosyltransferase family 4 protein n=1 Tax=Phenylobacterium sp. LjRoot219 TaxID=3342283 RepID=UPI003ED11694